MFSEPNILTAILGFLLVLAPLVILHELGHYLVGRFFGVKAEAFSVGFGKELAGYTDKRGTRWKLSALPLGGYVQFAGDMNPASQPDDDEFEKLSPEEKAQAFQSQSLGARAAIVAAGPLTNILIAIIIIAGFAWAFGKPVAEPVVDGFAETSVARDAGIELGDRIVAIDGYDVERFSDVQERVIYYPGEASTVTVERDGQRQDIDLVIGDHKQVDRFGNTFRLGLLGVSSGTMAIERYGPFEALVEGGRMSGHLLKVSALGVWQVISGRRSLDELGGPIKIAKFSGEQLVSGWYNFISFVALISINLAFINLLPIPVLDGGHLAFYAAEAVRRKPVSAKSQEWAFRTGLALVLALMVLVTVNDVISLDLFGS